jgi:two-component system sensor histidine kinase AlgZ
MSVNSSPAGASREVTRDAVDAPSSLPDFCDLRVVLVLVASGELLAVILAISSPSGATARWATLGMFSLFVQPVVLACAALLCHGRRYLCRIGDVAAASAAYLMIIVITVIATEIAFFIARGTRLEYILPRERHLQLLLQNAAIAAIMGAVVLRYFYVQARIRRTVEAESRARFQALQARIRPHFMFNSMNIIASLTRTNPALAEGVVEDLSDLFRDVLADPDRPSTLARELDLARRYLNIEKLRLGERLHVEERHTGVPLETHVPSLLIQPLVENAVYHGIEPLIEGGTIAIEVTSDRGLITVTIRNPCPDSSMGGLHKGNHIALANTRERLRLQFGARARLESSIGGGVYTVRLVFPVRLEGM